MEDRGLKISRKKTIYVSLVRFNGVGNLDGNSDINLQGWGFGKSEHILKSRSDIGREW